MEEQNTSGKLVLDFNEIIENFTSCILTVILREISYNGFENRREYFNACLDIKLLKYFCEEHNTYFQSFFYNNSDSSSKDVLVRYKNHIKIRRPKKKDESEDGPQENPRNKKKRTSRTTFRLARVENSAALPPGLALGKVTTDMPERQREIAKPRQREGRACRYSSAAEP
jgi:hypothetical protein